MEHFEHFVNATDNPKYVTILQMQKAVCLREEKQQRQQSQVLKLAMVFAWTISIWPPSALWYSFNYLSSCAFQRMYFTQHI